MPTFKKSMYDSIKIEVEGKTYSSIEPLDNSVLNKCAVFERDAYRYIASGTTEGDQLANYKLIHYLFKIPLPVLKKQDVRMIKDIVTFVHDCIMDPGKYEDEEKKKS